MPKKPAVQCGAPVVSYTTLKLPVMLGSLPLTMLPFLLPLYAKQFGANALRIGGLFAVAQGMTVLCRPVLGWSIDRWGRRGSALRVSPALLELWACMPWRTPSRPCTSPNC